METIQQVDLASARDVGRESGPSRADVLSMEPTHAKSGTEVARDLLGVTMALHLLPEVFPDGWDRHPASTAELFVSDDDRIWRIGRRRGDVVRLVSDVSGAPDSHSAAEWIIDLIGSLPDDQRAQWRPAPLAVLGPEASSLEAEQTDDRVGLSPGEAELGLPEIEDAADFLARDLPKPLELVEKILYQGSKMIFAADSKSFKTWTLLGLALSVAGGREFLGFATQQGNVLYINLEIQESFFADRIRAVARAKSVNLDNGRFDVQNLRGHATDMVKLLPRLLARIGTRKYALIVLDPIYKVLGGRDENHAGHISSMLNGLERLAVETGAAVVYAAHFSKGNQSAKASIDRVSGSGVFARDSDTIMALTQHEEPGSFTVEATLRNHDRVDPFVVRWEYPLMRRVEGLNPAKLKQSRGRTAVHSGDELLGILGDNAMSYKIWAAAAKEQAGIGPTTFKNLLGKLKAGGKVEQDKLTQAYSKAGKV